MRNLKTIIFRLTILASLFYGLFFVYTGYLIDVFVSSLIILFIYNFLFYNVIETEPSSKIRGTGLQRLYIYFGWALIFLLAIVFIIGSLSIFHVISPLLSILLIYLWKKLQYKLTIKFKVYKVIKENILVIYQMYLPLLLGFTSILEADDKKTGLIIGVLMILIACLVFYNHHINPLTIVSKERHGIRGKKEANEKCLPIPNDFLETWCESCNKPLYYRMERDSVLIECPRCNKLTSDVFCNICGIGGPFVLNLDEEPTEWICNSCKLVQPLPIDFYKSKIIGVTSINAPAELIDGIKKMESRYK
jgi:hypothetical protein